MRRLSFALSGHEFQITDDLEKALEHPDKSIIANGDCYILPDKTVWQFRKQNITVDNDENWLQMTAHNVTELYNGNVRQTAINDELKEVKSDHDYFDANIDGMRVTITPKTGLQPGTYTDTLYVHTENGAVHFITVTLTVTPKPEDSQQEADAALSGVLAAITGTNPFSDVPGGAYYNAAVRWAVKNGIASGTDAKHFSPDAACTRAQAVTFLWRAAGSPAPTLAENPFTDVKPSDYCYDAVLWAVENGIAKGTSAAAFSPDAACTRGQIVTFLYRAAGSPAGYANSGYTDVPETS